MVEGKNEPNKNACQGRRSYIGPSCHRTTLARPANMLPYRANAGILDQSRFIQKFSLPMPRISKSPGKSRHDPLLVQLDQDDVQAKYGRVSQPGKRKKSRKDPTNDEHPLDDGDVCQSLELVSFYH